jgi:hypothetical protein
MPIHDWTRVGAGIFHDFHGAWITHLREALNAGLLPSDYYALGEQIAGGLGPDVLTLRAPRSEGNGSLTDVPGTVAVAVAPPKVRLTARAEAEHYTRRQRTLVIRHTSDHRIIALVEIVSPGNKASAHQLRSLLDKALAALNQRIHLLLLDLFPPTPRDPEGLHSALWEQLTGEPQPQPADKPLTLAAYDAGPPVVSCYVEPVAVSDVLPPMPLFLAPEQYINVPLEPTYLAAYAGVPRYYRNILERSEGNA